MCLKDADGMTKSVDPDQTAPEIWVYTVCPAPSLQTLKIVNGQDF